jgi:Tfp pilus assembly protein PilP
MRAPFTKTLSLTFIGLALSTTLAHAQAAAPPAGTTKAGAVAPPAAAPPAATPAALTTPAEKVQNVLQEKAESAVEPQGFNYHPEGRRDPFVSLLRRGFDARNTGPKMAGLGGLGTAEVSLRGVLTSEGAFVGILQGADSKNYIVRVGDRLSDGTIRSITKDSMVILQRVNDPLSLEKQREVRKLLRQTEEAK